MSKFKFNPEKQEEGSPFCNGARALYAHSAVAFSNNEKEHGILQMDELPIEMDMATDLMSDIAQLADREGWDFEAMLYTVRVHWQAER